MTAAEGHTLTRQCPEPGRSSEKGPRSYETEMKSQIGMYKAEEQGCDVLKPREEEVDVIDGVDLLYKGR